MTRRTDADDAWVSAGSDLVVALSGVLDNAAELEAEWAHGGGIAGRGSTPADIVAAGLRRHGAKQAARRMRGIFAVAASDGRTLWSFRDQLGFHPIVYREEPAGLLLGAEPKQILAAKATRGVPDTEVLARIFYGSPEDDRSAISGVSRLAAATVLEAGEQGTTKRRYWDPAGLLERGAFDAGDLRDRFHHLMEQAVGRCLTGDDVVSLSGGVDSPAVAAFAAPLHLARTGRPLAALSAVFPDLPAVDESAYVEAVSRDLGLQLHTYRPAARSTDGLEEWVRLFDGPVPIVAFGQVHEFLEVTRGLGYRNVLSGEMEEFLFEMRSGVLAHLVSSGRIPAALRHARNRRLRGDRSSKLAKSALLGMVPRPLRSILLSPRRTGESGIPSWIDPSELARHRGEAEPRSWRTDQLAAFDGWSYSLSADDTIQEVAGVRERRPFADVDLWEFALGLSAEVKHEKPGSKALVRGLLRGKVPDIVLDRRDKTVFDSFVTAEIDYAALRGWLLDTNGPPIPGVDYGVLRDRLEAENITLTEFMWAKDLAGVHAFLSAW